MDDFMLDSELITQKSTDAYESLTKISKQLSKFEKKCKKAYSEINDHNELQSVVYTDYSDISETIENYIDKYNKFSGEAHTRQSAILGKNREEYYSNPTVVNSMGILGQYEEEVDAKFFAEKENIVKKLSETNLNNITIKNTLGIDSSASNLSDKNEKPEEININDILNTDVISIKLQNQYEEFKNDYPELAEDIKNYEEYMDAIVSGSDFQYATTGALFVSGVLDFVPYVGQAKLAVEILFGRNVITGTDLSNEERIFLLGTVVTAHGIGYAVGKVGAKGAGTEISTATGGKVKSTYFDITNPINNKTYRVGIGSQYGSKSLASKLSNLSDDISVKLWQTPNNKLGLLAVEQPIGPVRYSYAASSIVENATDLAVRNSMINSPSVFSGASSLKFTTYSNTINNINTYLANSSILQSSLNAGKSNLLLNSSSDISGYLESQISNIPKAYNIEYLNALILNEVEKAANSAINNIPMAVNGGGIGSGSGNLVNGSSNVKNNIVTVNSFTSNAITINPGKTNTRSENILRNKLTRRLDSDGNRIYTDEQIEDIIEMRNCEYELTLEDGDKIILKRHGYQKLEEGQSHHLNQDAAFRDTIPTIEAITIKLEGNAFTDYDSSHQNAHKSLEEFWDKYRVGGELEGIRPIIREYNEALKASMIAAGFSQNDSDLIVQIAKRQQEVYRLSEINIVPRIPNKIYFSDSGGN